jgi:hypothetical protein
MRQEIYELTNLFHDLVQCPTPGEEGDETYYDD